MGRRKKRSMPLNAPKKGKSQSSSKRKSGKSKVGLLGPIPSGSGMFGAQAGIPASFTSDTKLAIAFSQAPYLPEVGTTGLRVCGRTRFANIITDTSSGNTFKCIANLSGSTVTGVFFDPNSTTSFPQFLSQGIFASFQRYRVNFLKIYYVPSVGTTATGRFSVAASSDVGWVSAIGTVSGNLFDAITCLPGAMQPTVYYPAEAVVVPRGGKDQFLRYMDTTATTNAELRQDVAFTVVGGWPSAATAVAFFGGLYWEWEIDAYGLCTTGSTLSTPSKEDPLVTFRKCGPPPSSGDSLSNCRYVGASMSSAPSIVNDLEKNPRKDEKSTGIPIPDLAEKYPDKTGASASQLPTIGASSPNGSEEPVLVQPVPARSKARKASSDVNEQHFSVYNTGILPTPRRVG